MKVSNGVHFTRIWVTIATKWRHTPFYIRPNNLPSATNLGAFSRKLRVKFQGVKIKQKQTVTMLLIENYVHKTRLNGILVLDKSYNVYLSWMKISEKSPSLIFRNTGLHITGLRLYFIYLFIYLFIFKSDLTLLNWSTIKTNSMIYIFIWLFYILSLNSGIYCGNFDACGLLFS